MSGKYHKLGIGVEAARMGSLFCSPQVAEHIAETRSANFRFAQRLGKEDRSPTVMPEYSLIAILHYFCIRQKETGMLNPFGVDISIPAFSTSYKNSGFFHSQSSTLALGTLLAITS